MVREVVRSSLSRIEIYMQVSAGIGVGGTRSMSLESVGIHVDLKGVKALDGVDFGVERGEILGLIGPNGAGKTTLINVLSGFCRPISGAVLLAGADVTRSSPAELCRLGIARTFQSVRVFPRLSVAENVEVAGLGAGMTATDARRRSRDLLRRLDLVNVANMDAGLLPYGDERRLGIARAAVSSPHFLLMDEPAAGLNEEESDELVEVIRDIGGLLGCGIVVVEHDMRVIMGMCERIHVLDAGRTLSAGSPAQVQKDPAVVAAYLGTARLS